MIHEKGSKSETPSGTSGMGTSSGARSGTQRNLGLSTIAIHAGQSPEQWGSRSLVPPIVQSTAFLPRPEMKETGGMSGVGLPATGTKSLPSGMMIPGESSTKGTSGISGSGMSGRGNIMESERGKAMTGSTPETSGQTSTSYGGLSGAGLGSSMTGSPMGMSSSTMGESSMRSSERSGMGGMGRMGETKTSASSGMTGMERGMSELSTSESGRGMGGRVDIEKVGKHPRYAVSSLGEHGSEMEGLLQYGRHDNPTRRALETCLASLENARCSLAFSSGNACMNALCHLLQTGDHVLVIDEVYSDTKRFFQAYAKRMGVQSTFVDMNDLEETERGIRENTAMVWIETPTNPTLKVVDIKAICDLVRKKQSRALVVVDNTLATPVFQRPLELGADVVLHSLTKYINGHFDAVMGAIMTNDENLFRQLEHIQDCFGLVPSPFECYLVNRSIKTLTLRMAKHMSNAMMVANALQSHPQISKVIYPGLSDHPNHEIYRKQMSGFGGIITFQLKGNSAAIECFVGALKLIRGATKNLGGVTSLIDKPEILEMEGERGVERNLIRLSVGLEDPEDIINDLSQALDQLQISSK